MSDLEPVSPWRRAGLICPFCAEPPTWFNDVPLRAFCWGADGGPEHQEWSVVVPPPYNPYLKPYTPADER